MQRSLTRLASRLRYPFGKPRIQQQLDALPAHYMPGIGKGEFVAVGREFVDIFIRVAGLRPDERILDIGCGLGRMAMPLQYFLDGRGSYEGFDVVPEIIAWDTAHIGERDHRFRFRFVDVFNSSYNPDGGERPDAFRFPYDDADFDFVFATSVFTHLLDDAVECYLREIARVLRPGGRLLATFFLLDEETRRSIAEGRSDIDFEHPWKLGLLESLEHPENAVGYDAGWVFEALQRHSLRLRPPVHHGFWSGRPRTLSYQDVLIADKAR